MPKREVRANGSPARRGAQQRPERHEWQRVRELPAVLEEGNGSADDWINASRSGLKADTNATQPAAMSWLLRACACPQLAPSSA